MASSKSSSARPSPSLATATQKTRSAIQELQARLSGTSHPGASRPRGRAPSFERDDEIERLESEEELEQQLEAYFALASRSPGSGRAGASGASRTQILDELRGRVVDGVVERILAEWASGQPGASAGAGLGNEVLERLIERVHQQFRKSNDAVKSVMPS